MRRWLAFVVLLAACGTDDTNTKKAGETCSASSECMTGLLCDLDKDPHVCSDMGSLDAGPPDAKIDAHPLRDSAPDAP
jgi:hypothetical protein